MASPPPNATVYVKNLEESIKVEQLKEALTELFSEYGEIIDIVAKTNLKAKGQAFIVFDSVEGAQKAIEEVQGSVPDANARPIKATRGAGLKSTNAGAAAVIPDEYLPPNKILFVQNLPEEYDIDALTAIFGRFEGFREVRLATRGAGLKSTNAGAAAVIPDEYLPPNKILFVQNLPEEYDIDALTAIFGRFEGFREVRLVPGRRGIAFIEYESEAGAITAKENTAGMALGDGSQIMKVTYQRQ
ncbi:related to small nuclear ribonucleoprotein snRNP U1A [Phialocephala subalpina]|uniref:Related to small nuclear ribonucleoprotein snRNP U1A n=1 Tax=Phialocephala subalpina TaxID=576137 RepID=A0A1L7XDU2_9HELO|nr:related to small nuclear ribonucleoprotein snRNP U1A [Phialocephala subalpina]